jgi:hypothetical protein
MFGYTVYRKLVPVLWKSAANTLESSTVYNIDGKQPIVSPKPPKSAANIAVSVTA